MAFGPAVPRRQIQASPSRYKRRYARAGTGTAGGGLIPWHRVTHKCNPWLGPRGGPEHPNGQVGRAHRSRAKVGWVTYQISPGFSSREKAARAQWYGGGARGAWFTTERQRSCSGNNESSRGGGERTFLSQCGGWSRPGEYMRRLYGACGDDRDGKLAPTERCCCDVGASRVGMREGEGTGANTPQIVIFRLPWG